MSVKVRLQRGGRTHHPVYSIVVADSRSARDSKFIERLGFHLPKARGADVPFSINEERLAHWVGVGAQVTQVIGRLLVKYNAGTPALRDAFKATKAKRIKAEEATKAFADKRTAGKAAKEAKANEATAAAEAAAAAVAAKAAAEAEAAAAKAAAEAAKAEEVAKVAEAAATPAAEAAPAAEAPAEETTPAS